MTEKVKEYEPVTIGITMDDIRRILELCEDIKMPVTCYVDDQLKMANKVIGHNRSKANAIMSIINNYNPIL